MLKLVCAWCLAVMRQGDHPISHGICAKCQANALDEVNATIGETAEARALLRLAQRGDYDGEEDAAR